MEIVKHAGSNKISTQVVGNSGLVVEGFGDTLNSKDLQFPVAVLVQGAPGEAKRSWFDPSLRPGDVLVPGVGVIGGKNLSPEQAQAFSVISMKRYWNIYSPRGEDSERPIVLTSDTQFSGYVSADDLAKLGWIEGPVYDDKRGTYTADQLANVGEWSDAHDPRDEKAQNPPLATEMRDMLCMLSDGTLFWFRMSGRRDTGQTLRLVTTYVIQSGRIPARFRAVAVQRQGGPQNSIYYGLSVNKVAGIVPPQELAAVTEWRALLSGVKIEIPQGDTPSSEPKKAAPEAPKGPVGDSTQGVPAGDGDEDIPF